MRGTILALILVVSATAPAWAQAPNTITTIAGGGSNGTSPTGAYLPLPFSAVRDSNGNTYISVPGLNIVYKVDTTNKLTVFAGTGIGGFSGDGGPALQAQLSFPEGLAVDKNNNVFIADTNNERIRRVDTTGNITTVAGSEDPFFGAFGGDNGPATNARLNFPSSVAVDGNGDLFITDTNNGAVRRVDGSTQIITTIAGGGANAGCSGGAGNTAGFADLIGVAVDGIGNVFVADAGLHIVCEISATTGNVSTYAGTLGNPGTPGAANGDGGAATSAQMDQPNGVAVDSTGNLFITDSGNPKIRKVDTSANHIISTIAGIGFICGTGGISLTEPACGDGGAATSAAFDFPRGVFVDSGNNIIVSDTFDQRVRVIASGANPTIANFAGGGNGGDGGPATSAIFGVAQTIAVDSNENVIALETNGERIRKIAPASPNDITTVAGVGVGGATIGPAPLNGDGGLATSARFVIPITIANDSAGNFYIADLGEEVVRVINNQASPITVATVTIQPGDIAIIAGNGQRCGAAGNPNTKPLCGDNGSALSASLLSPQGVAVDPSSGNIYISDALLNTVRVVDKSTGTISTFAGTPGQACTAYPKNCGDFGAPTSALLNIPIGLATFVQGSAPVLYIADAGDNVIREVNLNQNAIFPVMFNGLPTFGGDGGEGATASMEQPAEIAVDDQGNIFVGGGPDNVVRRMDANAQTIITVAGDVDNLGGGFSGDGGPSTLAQIENFGLAVFKTAQGTHDLFIADSGNNRIRKVNLEPVSAAQPATGATLAFAPTLDLQTSDPQSIFFSNTGLDDLIFSNVAVSNSNFTLSNGCSLGAAPQNNCALTVTFAPAAGVTGTINGTLTFTTNDPANPSFTYNLTGTASNSPATLSVTLNPAAGGTVTSDPSGITCSSSPSAVCGPVNFAASSTVTLVAFPNPGFVFSGWSTGNAPGANCPGTGACQVPLPASGGVSVVANFTSAPPPPNATVTITPLGNGTGTVTEPTTGINCTITNNTVSGACSATVAQGTQLTFSATATGTSVFASWLAPCTGIASCQFSLFFNQNVTPVFSAKAQPFAHGQVFLSTGSGMVFVLDPSTGGVVQVLNSNALNLTGTGHGMTFDTVGNLFVTNDQSAIEVFSSQAPEPPTLFGTGNCPCDRLPFSVFLDPLNHVFVGESFDLGNSVPTLLQFPAGAGANTSASATFFPAWESSSAPPLWTELLDTSDTIAYTLGTRTVKSFDFGEGAQHPDIATNMHGAFALRELPDGTILVADTDRIARVTQSGNVTQTYTVPGVSALFENLNLDPDGVTFWTNDELTGIVYRINISSGAVANGSGFPTSVGFSNGTSGIGGIAVFGQPASGGADLSVTITGPTTITSGGTGSYSVVATNNGPLNATGVTLSFFIPGGQSIITSGPTGPVGCGRSININNGDETFTCHIGAMASGASDTFTYTVAPTGSITLTASVGATAPADPNPANNSASLTVTIGTPPTLVSITVTPNPASVAAGSTLQFTATGTFSDNSTQNLTSTATWSSSNTGIATINAAGLASGVTAGGPVTIKAAQSGVNGTAQLTVTAAPPPTFTLTVATQGTGNGTVTSQAGLAPAINCTTGSASGCTATYNSGQSVVLTATPLASNNSTFAGWSGACTNRSGTCSVTMTQAQSVTATFNLPGATPSFTSATLPGGAVSIPYGADLQASGGQQPYSFAITTGSLPTGFALVATSSGPVQAGHIFNDSPAAAGTFTFGVTVTDSTSPTPQTATATISLTIAAAPTNTQASLLKGQYALLLKAFDESGGFQGVAGSLTFDGKGNFTGIVDINSTLSGVTIAATVSGTYTVGPDNRGIIFLTETGQPGTVTLTIAVGGVYHGVATNATIIQFTDDDANRKRGAGTLQLQDPTSFTKGVFAGTYASQLTGVSSVGARSVYTGLFTFDTLGNITAFLDVNDGGTTSSGPAATGTYTGPDSNGRIVLSLPGPPFEDVIYQVSATQWVYQSLNPQSGGNDVGGGFGLRQTNPNSFTTASIAGPDVVSLNGTSGSGNSFALIGQLTASAGAVTVLADKNDGGNVTTNGTTTGTLTMAANGRGVLTISAGTAIIYLATPDSGFVVIQDSSVASGKLQPQVGGPFSNASLSGSLFFGTEEILSSTGGSVDSGVATVSGGNALNITDDESHPGGDLRFGQLQNFPIAVAASGRVTLSANTNNATVGYLSSPFELQVFDASSSNHPNIIEARSIVSPPGTPSPAATPVNFPTPVVVGTQVQSAPITITNTGLGPFTFVSVQAAADFTANAGTCLLPTPVTLQPQMTCTLIITFAPTASTPVNTPLNETVTVTTDGTSNIAITATGTAASAGGITITPSTTVNFGNQLVGTTSGAITTTVTNTSTTTSITITSVTLNPLPNGPSGTNPDGFTIVPGVLDCVAGTILAANGGNCVLPVTFGPTAPGTVSSTITLNDSGGNQVITLNGTGTAPAISLSAQSLSFSTAPNTTSAPQTVTVTNSGTAPLHINFVQLGGTDPDNFAILNGSTACNEGTVVQPQGVCTIGVDFTATSQATFTATVTISSDASNVVPTIALTGTGVVISIAPPPGGSTTATTDPGGKAVFPLVLSSTGLTGTATLTCSSPQPSITCAVVPGTVALTPNGVTHAAIVVNTFCSRLSPPDSAPGGMPPTAPWLIAIAGFALLASMSLTKKRTLRLAMPLAALLLTGIFTSSCGSPPKGPAGATPPGTYTLNITATVGHASSSVALTLIVK